jgi:hypothetical protein
MKNRVLLLVYDRQDVLDQTIYALSCFHKTSSAETRAQTEFIFYTDQAETLKSRIQDLLSFQIVQIDRETMEAWKNYGTFFFRIKIKLIEDFWKRFPDSNLLYTDADMVFRKDLKEVFDGIALGKRYMHAYEGVFNQQHPDARKGSTAKTIDAILKKHTFTSSLGKAYTVPNLAQLWNAGMIGFGPQDRDIIPEVLCFADEMYRLKDAHTCEQFGFSWFLQQKSELLPLESYAFHYWNFKEFSRVLRAYLEHHRSLNIAELSKTIELIDPEKLIIPKMKYLEMPFLKKNYYKYFKNKRAMPAYRFE